MGVDDDSPAYRDPHWIIEKRCRHNLSSQPNKCECKCKRGSHHANNHRQVDPRSSLAPGLPEDPVAHDLLGEAEGHDDEAEGEVGDGQRGHEPVLLRVERGLVED